MSPIIPIMLALTCLPLSAQKPTDQDKNADATAVELRAKAERGDPEAQQILGVYYSIGKQVTKDKVEAVNWYKKSAEQGNAVAQFLLGTCYAEGTGVQMNHATAFEWYKKSAVQGLALSQCVVGECYSEGKGVPKNNVEALKWFRKSADQGFSMAQTHVARCYAKGEGITQDNVMAYIWSSVAESSGDKQAKEIKQFILLRMSDKQLAEAKEMGSEFNPKLAISLTEQDSDLRRKKIVKQLDADEGMPTKMENGIYVHGYVYNKELDAIVIVMVGKIDKAKSSEALQKRWKGETGDFLRKRGFKDFLISSQKSIYEKMEVYSCKNNQWENFDKFFAEKIDQNEK